MVLPQLPYKLILPSQSKDWRILATAWASSLELCGKEKLVTKSFTSPWHSMGSTGWKHCPSFLSFTHIAPFSIKLRSKLCPVQPTAKNIRTVTHHKQASWPNQNFLLPSELSSLSSCLQMVFGFLFLTSHCPVLLRCLYPSGKAGTWGAASALGGAEGYSMQKHPQSPFLLDSKWRENLAIWGVLLGRS